MRRKLFRVGMTWRLLVALILALCLVPIGSSPVVALDTVSVAGYFEISYEPVELSKTEINGSESFNATIQGVATCTQDLPLTVSEVRITGSVTATHQASSTKVTLNSSYTVTISPFPNNKGDTRQIEKSISLQFPGGSQSGDYTVEGELSKAEVNTLLMGWLTVTTLLPPSQKIQTMGSVTYVALGGGGFGPAPTPTAEEIKTNLFGTEASFPISDEGVIEEEIVATSEDEYVTITIEAGTIALDKDDSPLISLEAEVDTSPPPPPKDTSIIGLAYDFGPDGVIFDPPITLTWSYDLETLPEDVDLVIAYYDEVNEEWVWVPCEVDTENNIITASVAHFTTFAIIAVPAELPLPPPPPAPAAFSVSYLSVSQLEVEPGETVTITVLVANTGGESGSYTVVLKIDGVKEAEETVTIAAGESQAVSFSVTKEEAGSYSVDVSGLTGSFTVQEEVVPPVVPPVPAAFAISNLSISPAEVDIGGSVTISVLVTNTGNLEGACQVTLEIDNKMVETQEVTLAGGASDTVTFKISEDVASIYSVNINGLSGSFIVKPAAISEPELVSTPTPPAAHTPPPAKPINWPVVCGIVAAVVAMGSLLFFLARRSHTKSSS